MDESDSIAASHVGETTAVAASESSVRPLRRNDIPAIKFIAGQTDLFDPELLDEMIAPYLDWPENRDVWIGQDCAQILVGFAYCVPERMTSGTWNVLALGVLPALQSTGIGTVIMGFLEKQVATEGARKLLVETSGLPGFTRTRGFYDKLGYQREARIRDFYERGDDKIIFSKLV